MCFDLNALFIDRLISEISISKWECVSPIRGNPLLCGCFQLGYPIDFYSTQEKWLILLDLELATMMMIIVMMIQPMRTMIMNRSEWEIADQINLIISLHKFLFFSMAWRMKVYLVTQLCTFYYCNYYFIMFCTL